MDKHNKRLHFTPAEQAILTTILYSDIFDFPLTKKELWHFLVSNEKISDKAFEEGLRTVKKYIVTSNGYYCLHDRQVIITKRNRRLPEVAKKLDIARRVAKKLSRIPTIVFIGISGGLAVGNATAGDDIDLFIIVKKDTLFVSRFFIVLFLEKMGIRRKRRQKQAANMICVNFLLDESAIPMAKERQDVYTAREIAQIQPLFEKQHMYRQFLTANHWIQRWLPNIFYRKPLIVQLHETFIAQLITKGFILLEGFFRALQLRYMKKHQTKEMVTKHVLAFHPKDYRMQTLQQLKLKMRQLGLLTKV